MFTRLANFGAGGVNLDQFETALQPNQWSRMDHVDANRGDLESAGADMPRGSATPVSPLYVFLYEGREEVFDIISDGDEVWARSRNAEWSPLLLGLTGGEVSYTVFRGCLVINSVSDGLFYWCQIYGSPFLDTWDGGFPGDWDDAYAPTWDDDESDLNVLDAWDTGPDETWDDGVDVPWSNFQIAPASPYQGWPTNWRARRVVAYKDQLVAVYVTGTPQGDPAAPFLVYWSSLAPPGALPNDWEPAVGNFAGYALAQDTAGQLVTAEVLRDDLILYKTDGSIWRLTATGDPSLPMILERVLSYTGGIALLRNVCEAGQVHFLVSRRGFGLFDGNQVQYLDFNRVQDTILRTLADNTYEFISCHFYDARQEVWITFSGPNAPALAGILKYNLQHNAFTVHEYVGKGLVSVATGREIPGTTPSDSWDDGASAAWNADLPDDSWDAGEPLPTTSVAVLGFTNQLATYRHYFPPQYVDGTPKTCRLERYGLRFDEGDKTLIKALYPEQMKGPVSYELGWGWAPNIEDSDSTRWESKRLFTAGENRRIPYRVIGDAFAIRMTTTEQFQLSAITVEHVPSARR
jgi:hypothetical protein